MYSKSKGMQSEGYILTPPPGYDGSRFRKRSDGRDDAFPPYNEAPHKKEHLPRPSASQDSAFALRKKEHHAPYEPIPCNCCDKEEENDTVSPPLKKEKGESGIASFIQSLSGEELLLIALIVLLAGGDNKAGLDTVLILALLLCI